MSKDPQEYFANWMLLNAIVLLAASAGYYFLYERWLLWALPALSIAAFVARTGLKIKVLPLTSPANWVTLLRLAGILVLFANSAQLQSLHIGIITILLLILDWLDGFIAKRTNTISEAGGILDKEVDAIMVLLLCFILFEKERADSWILLIGMLRYAYLLAIHKVKKQKPEPSFRYGKWIAGIFISGLIAGFILPEPFHYWAVLVGSILLVYSFVRSALYWIQRE